MVKVRKRDRRLEDFVESKVMVGCERAGATAKEAVHVGKEVSMKIATKAIVPAEKLSDMVVASLKKVNKAAADAFVKFREQKLKAK